MKLKTILLAAAVMMTVAAARAQQALPPQWLTPCTNIETERGDTISINPLTAQFTWTPVTLQLPDAPSARMTYSIRIVRLEPGMPADRAIETAPVVYKRAGLMTPMFTVPAKVLKNDLHEGETFVIQCRAEARNLPMGMRTESIVQNSGRSTLLLFRIN